MFNTHTDFTLNKFDKTAIVCQSVSGPNICLTREDFDSEEEFIYWKTGPTATTRKLIASGGKTMPTFPLRISAAFRSPLRRTLCLPPI